MAVVVSNMSAWQDASRGRELAAVADAALAPDWDATEVEISLTLVDDDDMARLNGQYRGVWNATDVLSFPMWTREQLAEVRACPEKFPERPLLLGDVVISVETARRQAARYGHSFGRELAFLFVHGVLHLLGYEHDDERSRAEMRRREEAVPSAAGWPR